MWNNTIESVVWRMSPRMAEVRAQEKDERAKKEKAQSMNGRTVVSNRQASYEYFILEKFEAGVVLTGTEIKSVRAGKVQLRDAYVRVRDGEAWLYNAHISPYEHGNRFNHEETRTRKLLLNKDEIREVKQQTEEKGMTIIPLRIYFKRGLAKVEIALARGKKLYDKRDSIAERESSRELERMIKEKSYS